MSDSEKLQNWGEQETLEQMQLEVLVFEMVPGCHKTLFWT
jgi:hypothetical protein